MSGSMQARVVTALVLASALLLVLLLLPPWATLLVLSAVVLAGAWEWSAFVRPDSTATRLLFLLTVAALLPLAWNASSSSGGRRALLLLTTLWWCLALLWLSLAPQRVPPWAAALAGILALVPMSVALMRLRLIDPRGGAWTLFCLALAFAADTGGFFIGSHFGRVKLAPRVSPGKTWEGVLGGVVLGSLVSFAGAWYFRVPALPLLLASVVAIAFSVVGDLTESMLKRRVGVKDSGWLFPGHGGVMDRIDSVTAAAPVFLLGVSALGVLP